MPTTGRVTVEKDKAMLIRKMLEKPFNLYEEDATLGTQQAPKPTPATSQDRTEDKGEEVKLSLTQRELNRITAKETKTAKASVESELLAKLGVTNLDEAVSKLSAIREKENNEKSESQKLAERLAALEKDNADKDARLAETEKARRIESRDNKLLSLLQKAHDPSEVLATLKATQSAKLDEFLSDNGEFDSAAATAFIADYQAKKPYQFKDERRGSQSNNDGRIPNPDKDRRKAVEKKLSKTIQGF